MLALGLRRARRRLHKSNQTTEPERSFHICCVKGFGWEFVGCRTQLHGTRLPFVGGRAAPLGLLVAAAWLGPALCIGTSPSPIGVIEGYRAGPGRGLVGRLSCGFARGRRVLPAPVVSRSAVRLGLGAAGMLYRPGSQCWVAC